MSAYIKSNIWVYTVLAISAVHYWKIQIPMKADFTSEVSATIKLTEGNISQSSFDPMSRILFPEKRATNFSSCDVLARSPVKIFDAICRSLSWQSLNSSPMWDFKDVSGLGEVGGGELYLKVFWSYPFVVGKDRYKMNKTNKFGISFDI